MKTDVDDRINASDLIDYTLYCYAIWRFIVHVASIRNNGFVDIGVYLTFWAALIFFVFVLLRNYIVMHAVDTADWREDGAYAFVKGNSGPSEILERLSRYGIMITVIITPEGSYPTVQSFVSSVVSLIVREVNFAVAQFNIIAPHHYAGNNLLHTSLPYYGVVLISLFGQFIFWDLINVVSIALRIRSGSVRPAVDFDRGEVGDDEYRAFLRYCNICKSRQSEESDLKVYFTSKYLEGRAAKSVSEARIFRLYFLSAKPIERILGIFTAFMLILSSIFEMGVFSIFLTAVFAVLYLVTAFQNEGYWRGMWGFVKFPFSYFIMRQNPYSLGRAAVRSA